MENPTPEPREELKKFFSAQFNACEEALTAVAASECTDQNIIALHNAMQHLSQMVGAIIGTTIFPAQPEPAANEKPSIIIN